jgi:hypothetical protein
MLAPNGELTALERYGLRLEVLHYARAGRLDRDDRRRLLAAIPRYRSCVEAFRRDLERSDLMVRDLASGIGEPGDTYTHDLVRELVSALRPVALPTGQRTSARAPRARRARTTRTTRAGPLSGDDPPEPEPHRVAGFDRLEVLVRRVWAHELRRIGAKAA